MAPPAVKRNLDFSYRHYPMLNEVSTSLSSYLASQGQIAKKKALMRWYKNTPELVGFTSKVTNDACNFYHFEPIGGSSGRNRIHKANAFALNMGYRQMRAEVFADCLITGDGFGWKGKMPIETLSSKLKEVFSRYSGLEQKGKVPVMSIEVKQKLMNQIYNEMKSDFEVESDDVDTTTKFLDEDVLALKQLRYVPSTTVEVVYDRYDVKGYNHFLGVYLPMFFSPEEIIHFTLMKRDGKVNGFTPIESCIVQVELLRQMWQNQLSLHRNGGAPDKVFNVENLQVGSPAYQRIVEQVQKYKLAENKHGNMVFTGKLNVIDLQQLDEMQFKDVGLYVTGLIAMQWGLPKSSIPFVIGGTNTKDDTGGNAERGYWQFIRGLQLAYDEYWNTQLWIPYFKVKVVSELSFPQLEVQEEAARQAKIQNLTNMDALLIKHGKTISEDKKMEILGLTDDDLEDASDDMKAMSMPALNTGTPKTSKDKPQSDQGVGKAVAKRQEQQNTMASRGKPSGYGKEDFEEFKLELKTFIPKLIQESIINTRYENQPKVRKDQPVKQLSDNNQSKVGKQDSAIVTDGSGPEMPADWAVTKDRKIGKAYPEPNLFTQPQITRQLNTYPTGSITTENLANPAGNIGYGQDNFHQGTGDNTYVSESESHDTPQTKPKKVSGNFPTQRKYPDEHTQFPGQDEKETQAEMGMAVEEEHRDVYEFITDYLKMHKKMPDWADVKKRIVNGHLDEISDYYSRLKILEDAKEFKDEMGIEIKDMDQSDVLTVDMNTFVKVYTEDSRFNAGKPPRVFMRKSYAGFPIYSLKFKSSDFVYKTQISETDLKTTKANILLSNIRGQIYRL
jgi:hypothetical protein